MKTATRQPASIAAKPSGLEGKVVLVTGGGRGLGAAINLVLREAGARVIAADIRAAAGNRTGQDEAQLSMDVSDERQVSEGIDRILRESGRLDVLINNAGVDKTVPIEEMSAQDWDRILGVNLRGPFLLTRKVLPLMKRQRSGHIVNIVSTASKRTWANASAYHASKWGLLGFSHAMHVEARPAGVKVTAVVCGGMRTPFLLERFPDIDRDNLQDPRNVAETIRFVLCQPAGTVIPEIMVLPLRETSWP